MAQGGGGGDAARAPNPRSAPVQPRPTAEPDGNRTLPDSVRGPGTTKGGRPGPRRSAAVVQRVQLAPSGSRPAESTS